MMKVLVRSLIMCLFGQVSIVVLVLAIGAVVGASRLSISLDDFHSWMAVHSKRYCYCSYSEFSPQYSYSSPAEERHRFRLFQVRK